MRQVGAILAVWMISLTGGCEENGRGQVEFYKLESDGLYSRKGQKVLRKITFPEAAEQNDMVCTRLRHVQSIFELLLAYEIELSKKRD